MNELKTLKDCCYNLYKEGETADDFFAEPIDGVVRETELKKESIKWYKEIDECSKDFKKTIVLNDNLICLADIPVPEFSEKQDPTWLLKQWIKHFFNLKDSELK